MEINRFREQYFFLSNFYPAIIEYDGLVFHSVEAAFQSAKTLNPSEKEIFTGLSPVEAKRAGRRVKLRKDWEREKDKIMYELCFIKFSTNPHLKKKLLETGEATLIEGNPFNDTYWGVCNGTGLNKLGKILMEIREELRHENFND